MNKTAIEWVKNPDGTQGYTWNPITGCLNHTNGLCKGGGFPCYAYRLAQGRLFATYCHNTNLAPSVKGKFDKGKNWVGNLSGDYIDPFYPRFWMERIEQADREMAKAKAPMGIFFNDMSDWMGIGVPESWTNWILELAKRYPQHRIYTLTKQPQNLIKFSPFPDNCWVGVTCTSTEMFAQSIIKMQGIKATVKYISFEPLLEWNWNNTYQEPLELVLKAEGISWLIIGAQTKPYKPPKIEWVEEIVRSADQAGIPVFLKDNLKPLMETLDITGMSFGRLTSLTLEAIRDTQGLPRQRGWYEIRQEIPGEPMEAKDG